MGIHPLISQNLKTGIRSCDYQSNESIPRLYGHPFYTYLICPRGIAYNPLPEGCGVVVIPKDIIFGS